MNDLNTSLLRVLVAALAGGLIGVERERSQHEQSETSFAGARTFPLIAILGASLTLVSGTVGAAVIAGFLGVAGLIVAAYFMTAKPGHPGVTTEMAAFATYWIGVMAGAGSMVLAGAIAVGTAVLLASKARLEGFSRALTNAELSAALTLAVLAAVILPILPNVPMGPWGIWNPRTLWLVVVFVCGLSFVAFVGMRVWGAAKGVYVSGILGGLVSSTAATVAFATRSRQMAGYAPQLAVGAGLASVVMILRVALLTGVTNRDLLISLAPFLASAVVAGAIPILLLARRAKQDAKAPDLQNPFQLMSALKFAALYAAVLLVVEVAKREFGSWGLIVAAVLAGLVDVDAITLALAGSGMPPDQAGGGIALAVLSNTFAKAGYAAWFGEGEFRRRVLLILGVVFVVGALVLVIHQPS